MNKHLYLFLFFCLLLPVILPAQEALKSIEENYYDFLALQGLTKRPTLNYRTLSDSVWTIDDSAEHPWQDNNLSAFHPLFGDFRLRAYGPELYMSYNTRAPYGHNDGVLWQGRGFNSLFKGGVRLEGYGIELTIFPHFSFSQNTDFETLPSWYESEYGYFWGYGAPKSNSGGVDAPQRFGNNPFFDWDFGDSEIRYTWRTLTVGFGTQAIWLGPSYINPILHSNNAPVYPKFDIGLRRQKVTIPWLDWYAGDIEFRYWLGRLIESDYFDNNDSNNYTMFHGISIAYAPSFLPGFSLFFNRVCLAPWDLKNIKYIYDVVNDLEDQKASVGLSWIFPQVGFEVFGELAIDDWSSFTKHPFHTTVFNVGFKKTMPIKPVQKIYGELLFELSYMEKTQEYIGPYSFYSHSELIHGYTNRGQWLGNAESPIGNAQSLKFTLYYPKGNSGIMISRNNPNNHYIYERDVLERSIVYHNAYWTNINLDIDSVYFFNSYFIIFGGLSYNRIIDRNYIIKYLLYIPEDTITNNFSFRLGVKFIL